MKWHLLAMAVIAMAVCVLAEDKDVAKARVEVSIYSWK